MSIFKCKMCGGTIEFEHGSTVGVCEYCGTKQTLPRLDDDKKANLYDRANHFRRNNDFDKAMIIYEKILNEDSTDAEAYWSLVLCRYGIEYVEDPATHKRIPTVNRAQFTSVFADENYKSALQFADGYQKQIYEEEANAIDDIQKGILEISGKEEPFDVFICYKDTDNNGRRTVDSVLANDIYHQLVQEGYKVFFSRITLEDKLGTAYEPYIFAALNSAKVMVVLGTKPEFFNAVWVKNEWSRYLTLIKNGAKKMLIPAYRDMDPYDLPEEFSHLQAQDMSKLGFMQDLIRGIKKIISADVPKQTVKETVAVSSGNTNVAPLLKRAFMFLEDGAFDKADDFCEQVLNQDPECASAYLGKLMAELCVKNRENLKDCAKPFDNSNNYRKVLRFGDEEIKVELCGYIDHINKRNENARQTGIYNNAVNAKYTANTEQAYKAAAQLFQTIRGFKDADALAEQCFNKAEICRKDEVYAAAKSKTISNKAKSSYEEAINIFKTISGWKDADEQIYACQKKIEEIKVKEEADCLEAERKRIAAEKAAKKRKKIIAIVAPIVCACVAFIIVFTAVIIPNSKYSKAEELAANGNYDEAITVFAALNGYKDSTEKIVETKYNQAISLIDSGDYDSAYTLLNDLEYKDSSEKASECAFLVWKENLKKISVGENIEFGIYEQDNNTSNGKEEIEWKVLAVEGSKALIISEYALDALPYNEALEDVTWEKSALRSWLNETFYNSAFDSDHQTIIESSNVSADKNPKFDTDPGNATTDKVFLLSIAEAEKYFSSNKDRKCVPTDYAISQGATISDSFTEGDAVTCWWWLRSPGDYQSDAAVVNNGGSVYYSGDGVCSDYGCVRPAMWISLDS